MQQRLNFFLAWLDAGLADNVPQILQAFFEKFKFFTLDANTFLLKCTKHGFKVSEVFFSGCSRDENIVKVAYDTR